MIDLAFGVSGARAHAHAAVPTLMFRLQIREAQKRAIHAILLRCQLQIEPRRRRHVAVEQERLIDVFGTAERWGEMLRPLVWAQTTLNVTAFEGSTEVDLPVACTYDFDVTSAKYLAALDEGDVPLRFLFSGTVFVKAPNGFMVQQVPWDKEAVYRMPLSVWHELMESYFPGAAWIRVRRETLDLLQRFRAKNGLTSWDEAIEAMLAETVR
jgi:Family of unknown function (DUF6084)